MNLPSSNIFTVRFSPCLCLGNAHKDVDTKVFEARCFDTAMAGAKPQVERAIAEKSLQLASNGAIRVAAR